VSPVFANGASTGAMQFLFNAASQAQLDKARAQIVAEAEAAFANQEPYGVSDRAGNFPSGSYKCNKFVCDMANRAGAKVGLNVDKHGNAWPPTAGKWGWGDTKADIPGWKIVNKRLPGDVVGQKRNYSDATGHVGIYIGNNNVISARNNGVSKDLFTDVFPSHYSEPVIYRRFVGN